MVEQFRHRAGRNDLCRWLSIPRSSHYYQPSNEKRGRKPSVSTAKSDGSVVPNQAVVSALIEDVYSQEFVRYGYQLSTEELQEMGFLINEKKVYRLMKENGLLLDKIVSGKAKRQWVKWRIIKDAKPMEHICMDIKYVYIHGIRRNAYLLAIMDVATRYVLGWTLRWSMKHTDVILCLHGALKGYTTSSIILRTDNGSQFIAHGLQKYVSKQEITHEFTHVATPEENSYVESLFSCVERDVIQAYEFENLFHAKDVFERYFDHHNIKRRRHSLGRKSPIQYWNSAFHYHPVRPPEPKYGGLVKGDDTIENLTILSSLVLPLTKPECEVILPNQDDNEKQGKVLNLFEKSVQAIGG
jgi:transposase InsO family protein